RQVAKLHRLHDAVDDHGRSKPCSQTQKKHLAAGVAPQSLHGGVVDDFHGLAECGGEIEPNPSPAKIVRFGNWPAMQNGAGIADRNRVIAPAASELLDAGHHLAGTESRPRGKCTVHVLASGEYLDRSSADIDDQHSRGRRRPRTPRSIWS